MRDAQPDRGVDVVVLEIGGRDPCQVGGLPGARQLAADLPGVQADVDGLADSLTLSPLT
jgi:hypothetical protein